MEVAEFGVSRNENHMISPHPQFIVGRYGKKNTLSKYNSVET